MLRQAQHERCWVRVHLGAPNLQQTQNFAPASIPTGRREPGELNDPPNSLSRSQVGRHNAEVLSGLLALGRAELIHQWPTDLSEGP